MMPSSHAPLIHIHQLTTGYLERGKPIPIAEGLELTINQGEVIMLMGPNGSGKSTLMHTMAGLRSQGIFPSLGKPSRALRPRSSPDRLASC